LFPLPAVERLAEDVVLLRGFADPAPLLEAIHTLAARAPFRILRTRAGPMSVAMSNCGEWGWHSDEHGYRYVDRDPETGLAWPAMPATFRDLARRAADSAGFAAFDPDCCLINRYAVGAKMGTHRDFDELDMTHPIVSVSLGLPASFLWYGAKRSGKPLKVELQSGDVLVWGASARAGYHGVRKIEPPPNADAAGVRYNLTFRRAK
jgi:alkylated DNA repair protein (DNA oxidative demethylase)